jgi:cephalosporin hydroxylase
VSAKPFDDLGMSPEGEAYIRWFVDNNVWKGMTWHGVRTLKLPSDIWNYQEILFERRIEHVVETGTRHGGSALFFADTLAARGVEGRVVSIDIDALSRQLASHNRITFLIGDSAAPAMVEKALALLPPSRGPIFLILDSDGPLEAIAQYLEEAPGLLQHDRARESKFGTSLAARGYYTRI